MNCHSLAYRDSTKSTSILWTGIELNTSQCVCEARLRGQWCPHISPLGMGRQPALLFSGHLAKPLPFSLIVHHHQWSPPESHLPLSLFEIYSSLSTSHWCWGAQCGLVLPPRILAEQQWIVRVLALQFSSVEELILWKYPFPKNLPLGDRGKHPIQAITLKFEFILTKTGLSFHSLKEPTMPYGYVFIQMTIPLYKTWLPLCPCTSCPKWSGQLTPVLKYSHGGCLTEIRHLQQLARCLHLKKTVSPCPLTKLAQETWRWKPA